MKSKQLKQYESMQKLLDRQREEEELFAKWNGFLFDSPNRILFKPYELSRIEQELAYLARKGIVPTMPRPEK